MNGIFPLAEVARGCFVWDLESVKMRKLDVSFGSKVYTLCIYDFEWSVLKWKGRKQIMKKRWEL